VILISRPEYEPRQEKEDKMELSTSFASSTGYDILTVVIGLVWWTSKYPTSAIFTAHGTKCQPDTRGQ
jgi:hypothetical protein